MNRSLFARFCPVSSYQDSSYLRALDKRFRIFCHSRHAGRTMEGRGCPLGLLREGLLRGTRSDGYGGDGDVAGQANAVYLLYC